MIEWLGTSCFSFLEGATRPLDLIRRASEAGYGGIALADRMSQSGLVQALHGADEARLKNPSFFYAPGIRLHFDASDPLFIYPLHRGAHAALCRFLSAWSLEGMRVGEKGLTPLRWRDFIAFLRTRQPARDFVVIAVSGRFYPWVAEPKTESSDRVRTQDTRAPAPSFSVPPTTPGQTPFWLLELAELCGRGAESALSLAYPLTLAPGCEDLHRWLEEHSARLNIPLLATTLPLFADKVDHDLCDLLTAIRHTRKVSELGYLKQANGERRILLPYERQLFAKLIAERFGKNPRLNDPFERGYALAARQSFSLAELKYHYPRERIPAGISPAEYLERITMEGAAQRYPQGIPLNVHQQLRHELSLVAQLGFEDYFLTIWDILRYAREQDILFQGRGSAANSALCYCLHITAIDPVRMNFLFERFISLERREPPDIDVDFEHERREEVIQEVYRRYGRENAAMVASYICFRSRMAFRESAKALGLAPACIDGCVTFMGREGLDRLLSDSPDPYLRQLWHEHGVTPQLWRRVLEFAQRLRGLPRHVGLHTGGFVLSDEKLSEQCVLEPARMENRSQVPWDKDDVDYLGWMKVDLLALGMLTALKKTLALLGNTSLTSIPQECPQVYRAMCRGDTVGVFQIESRAQMNMLPRLAPKCFYDIVVEVAIVRPGPLQGGMVHPYIRRRQGLEAITYEHPDLVPILEKTCGITIFQEQVMKIAVAVAGFTPGEADQLRKVMSGSWRSKSEMHKLHDRLLAGMNAKGISRDLSERLYRQIEGFGEYGFPESHAASFALLTYASMWLKVHRPAEFLCGLLNSQPLGFYPPRALVGDAERHGVKVLPIDIRCSRWDAQLTPAREVRLGLRLIGGLSRAEAAQIETLQSRGILNANQAQPPLRELMLAGLSAKTLEKLVSAHACRRETTTSNATADPRRTQSWELLELRKEMSVANQTTFDLPQQSRAKSLDEIPDLDEWQSLLRDFRTVGLSPGQHPARYAREKFFAQLRPWTNAEGIYQLEQKKRVFAFGLLTIKQRPPTATGVTFLTLEDESGFMNLVLFKEVYEGARLVIEQSPFLAAEGLVERSARLQSDDPYSAAVSIQVLRIWNPFLGTQHTPLNARDKPRHYH
ncbi:MAG: error-prone DNA polymerase [Bdellovibrionales bacterium]|nr:error-prone DNA polymerase [Bdellovibrionales bacterium]